jgi:Uma2 family endonuclease
MVMPNLKRQCTVADRDELPDDGSRYEVIDGELFVTPAPAWRHQEAVVQLYRLIAGYLDLEPIGHAFMAPADVVFSPKARRSARPVRRADLDSRIVERSTPSEPRPEILDTRLELFPDGATLPLTIDLIAYFRPVLDS